MPLDSVVTVAVLVLTTVVQQATLNPAQSSNSKGPNQIEAQSKEPVVPLREQEARSNAHLEAPESLHDIKQSVEQCYGTKLSIEPLPEQCAGAGDSGPHPDPFWILEGERFGDVIERLEGASQGRWIFEEIHGVPLLRPDPLVEGHGTLLDTIVSIDLEASTMWEALCALARAVNQSNQADGRKNRMLIIRFLEPTLMKLPPPIFVQEKAIRVSLMKVTAREALCAIFGQVGTNIRYSYTCVAEGKAPNYDYVDVSAFDGDGRALNGGRIAGADYTRLLKSESWMSDDGILSAQSPVVTKQR